MQETQSFVDAACARGWGTWSPGNPRRARHLLARSPLPGGDPWLAAAAADLDRLRDALAGDPGLATRPGGPRGWVPLLYASFSVLHQGDPAAEERLAEIGRVLLTAGARADVHTVNDEEGCNGEDLTALYGATRVANAALVDVLLDAGATDSWGNALYTSAEQPPRLAELLISGGANPHGNNVLMHHVGCGRLDSVRRLLEQGVDPDSSNPYSGDSALHVAIRAEPTEELGLLLLDRGADPSVVARDGTPAYRLAVRLGQARTTERIRELGAAVPVQPMDELLGACRRDDPRLVRDLLDRDPGLPGRFVPGDGDVLGRWATFDDAGALRRAADAGLPLDREGTGPLRPLHEASWRGRPAAVRVLLEAEADVESINGFGGTPLSACVHGRFASPFAGDHREAIEVLLEAGAEPGVWPIRFAAEHGDVELVLRLRDAGADPGARPEGEPSAMDLLASQGLSL